MKIRALTLGQPLKRTDLDFLELEKNLVKLSQLKQEFEKNTIDVEYIRFSAPKIDSRTNITNNHIYSNLNHTANNLDELVDKELLGIYSFAPILADQSETLTSTQNSVLSELSSLLKTHANMFSSVQVASTQNGLNFNALEKAINIMQNLAVPDPFHNVQFAITFNVPPNTPFFPSAYYSGEIPTLSIALEAADELNNILTQFPSYDYPLNEIQDQIRNRFEEIHDEISSITVPFCEKHGYLFEGIDLSPAPYPTYEKSIGTALELVNLSHFGEIGSVFAVGFLTQAIQAINRPRIGFSGFMQPLLEDYTIARRNNESKVDLSKLLLYSTMCGLGLDCVPIPGDVSSDQIHLLLLDLAMISMRLNKPLSARLMPIPRKQAGELTEFDFEYFTNSKILALSRDSNGKISQIRKNNRFFKLLNTK